MPYHVVWYYREDDAAETGYKTRSAAGNPGHDGPAHAAGGRCERLRNREGYRAAIGGCAASRSRISLSSASPPGKERPDCREMGSLHYQAARPLLPANRGWKKASYLGTLEMAADGRGDLARHATGVGQVKGQAFEGTLGHDSF